MNRNHHQLRQQRPVNPLLKIPLISFSVNCILSPNDTNDGIRRTFPFKSCIREVKRSTVGISLRYFVPPPDFIKREFSFPLLSDYKIFKDCVFQVGIWTKYEFLSLRILRAVKQNGISISCLLSVWLRAGSKSLSSLYKFWAKQKSVVNNNVHHQNISQFNDILMMNGLHYVSGKNDKSNDEDHAISMTISVPKKHVSFYRLFV